MNYHYLPAAYYLKLFFSFSFIMVLTACAAKPNLENQTIINLNNNLAQLNMWTLKGKMAWITDTERKSANINWQQNNTNMRFRLSNVLGITLASLSYDGTTATLLADGKEYQGASPSTLVHQTTGWQVPLEQLSSWIKGAASSQGRLLNTTLSNADTYSLAKQQITRYENGLIKQIKPICVDCKQWVIDYTSYQNVIIGGVEYQLPQQLSLFNSAANATIKIKISEWTQ